ncbi:MAG TPA: NAD(P)-dependent alcohol dehydrogenase, partial [Myxococcota bacterium]|nr:NAD(P)-dependent alcohol dehydrogenase [Myxococcota bacterium]
FLEEGLVKFPEHLSYEEAATLPCAAVTAFNAIAYQSGLRPNDVVLLEGTGGVSLFALQFAKAFNIDPILISSSNEKLAMAKKLSEFRGINYLECPDWSSKVRDFTQGEGVDAVVEVGGKATIGQAIQSVKKGGVICVIGVLSGTSGAIDLRPILMNNLRLQGIFVGAKTVFLAMNRVITHCNIHPVIDRVFSFDEAPKALAYLEGAKHFGKVVIKVV